MDALRREVASGRLPGAVALVARQGQIALLEAVGQQDPATGSPMQTDSIFRIYSMTKPIVSVAVMML
ncbi:MAG: serine hydrolase, partial [Rhodoferax sp.]